MEPQNIGSAAPTGVQPEPPKEEKATWLSVVWETAKFVILAALIVLPIRLYVAQPYIVSGTSMDPTFKNGDYLIIDRLTYKLESPKRGDVIVFRFPEKPSIFFIKRIIGVPGDTITSKDGTITFTNKDNAMETPLPEPYLTQQYSDTFGPITLKDGEYFTMGDNRSASLDSRVWGTVPTKDLIGRAFLRLFPPTSISILPGQHNLAPNNNLTPQ